MKTDMGILFRYKGEVLFSLYITKGTDKWPSPPVVLPDGLDQVEDKELIVVLTYKDKDEALVMEDIQTYDMPEGVYSFMKKTLEDDTFFSVFTEIYDSALDELKAKAH